MRKQRLRDGIVSSPPGSKPSAEGKQLFRPRPGAGLGRRLGVLPSPARAGCRRAVSWPLLGGVGPKPDPGPSLQGPRASPQPAWGSWTWGEGGARCSLRSRDLLAPPPHPLPSIPAPTPGRCRGARGDFWAAIPVTSSAALPQDCAGWQPNPRCRLGQNPRAQRFCPPALIPHRFWPHRGQALVGDHRPAQAED